MQSRIIVLTLLILSIDTIICMRCYEGFNASVAGVPFYHWAERQCKGDSECMIHDVVFKDGNFGVSVRYGGCISSSYSSLATCEQLFGEESTVTLRQYYTLIASGDEKIRNFRMDFYQDPETHGQLFYSRGKEIEEFYSGVLTFLGNLGFDKKKIKAPLKGILIEYLANDYVRTKFDALEDLLEELLNSMMVTNEATIRLSRALLECLGPAMYTSFTDLIPLLPNFLYPIVSLELNATDVYNTISEGFESASRKDFNSVLPEENIKTFLLSLNFFQLFINDFTTTNEKTVYHFSIQTIEVYMKAYPDSPIPKAAYSVAEVINRYDEMLSRLYPNCSGTVDECESQNAQEEKLLIMQRSKEILDILSEGTEPHESSNLFTVWYDIRFFYLWCDQVTYEDYIEIAVAWSHWVEKAKLKPQATLFNFIFYISRPVNNIAKRMDEDSRKKFRKGIAPRSCKHYFCASDLCNRHGIIEAVQPSLGNFSGKVEHEEL